MSQWHTDAWPMGKRRPSRILIQGSHSILENKLRKFPEYPVVVPHSVNNSVWHTGLFHKLQKGGITGNFINLIKDLYKKTKCAIKVNDRITDFFNYSKGVRQGCPLSSVLFNLYVNDIFDTINKHSTSDVYLNRNNKINALMYADDLVLISRTKEGLQRQIDSVYDYCEKWKLSINIKKTKSMIFNRGNNLIKTFFNVGGSPIENVKSFTYLGFTISAKNCSFQNTINALSIKANRAVFAIKNNMKLSQLPLKLAKKIFQSQIVPILLYGSEIWGPYMNFDYATWDKNKIERVQTQFLKQILGCNYQTSNNMVRADTYQYDYQTIYFLHKKHANQEIIFMLRFCCL